MPGGRPALDITPEFIAKVERLAAQGLTQEQICHVLGVAVSTLCKYKAKNKEITEAISRGKAKGIAKISNKLFDKAMAGDSVCMLFYLKCRDRENWQDSYRIDHTLEAEVKINPMTDKKRKQVGDRIKRKLKDERSN